VIAPTSINRREQIFICGQRKVVNFIQTDISYCVLLLPRPFSSSERRGGFFGPGNGDQERDEVQLR
jgi:hypothetical protein